MRAVIINMFFFFLFLASALKSTDHKEIWERTIFLLLVGIVVIQLINMEKKIRIDYKTMLLFFIFIVVSGVSSLVNSDIKIIQGALLLFILYIASFTILSSNHVININQLLYRT